MRILMVVWFSLHVLYAGDINQKMILSAYFETEKAAQSLYEIEKFFQENSDARALKAEYHLRLGMELLEPYVVVSLKPITQASVKNKLHYLLQSEFPQNFVVDNTTHVKKVQEKEIKTSTIAKPIAVKKQKEIMVPAQEISMDRYAQIKRFFKTLDSEWLGLIFLALAGFMLIYRSAKQMSKIRSLQEEVTKYQSKIEGEIHSMGDRHA